MLAAGPANRVRVKRGRLSRRIRCARTLSTSQSANDSQPVRMPKLAVEAANVVPGQLLDTAFPVKSTEDRLSIMTAHRRADPRRQNLHQSGAEILQNIDRWAHTTNDSMHPSFLINLG
jgi:hypothetical protein